MRGVAITNDIIVRKNGWVNGYHWPIFDQIPHIHTISLHIIKAKDYALRKRFLNWHWN